MRCHYENRETTIAVVVSSVDISYFITMAGEEVITMSWNFILENVSNLLIKIFYNAKCDFYQKI